MILDFDIEYIFIIKFYSYYNKNENTFIINLFGYYIYNTKFKTVLSFEFYINLWIFFSFKVLDQDNYKINISMV